jgi:hypothetical protein
MTSEPTSGPECAERHGCELDMQATGPVIARHHLVF